MIGLYKFGLTDYTSLALQIIQVWSYRLYRFGLIDYASLGSSRLYKFGLMIIQEPHTPGGSVLKKLSTMPSSERAYKVSTGLTFLCFWATRQPIHSHNPMSCTLSV